MWHTDKNLSSDVEEWLHPITHPPTTPPRVELCMAFPIGYGLAGNSCSHDPDWGTQWRNGCLLVVSVTHTTPPGGRLCMVVMIHHSWLSGTLLSEENDIISIFQLGRVWPGGVAGVESAPTRPETLGFLMRVIEAWNRGWCGCGWSHIPGGFREYLGTSICASTDEVPN